MTPIPPKLRAEMACDIWYSRCCRCGNSKSVQWHHVIIWKGAQLQRIWAIVPACEDCHIKVKLDQDVKGYFEWIALNRATDEELKAISKATDYLKLRDYLNKKYDRS